jgi:hypothetical protein
MTFPTMAFPTTALSPAPLAGPTTSPTRRATQTGAAPFKDPSTAAPSVTPTATQSPTPVWTTTIVEGTTVWEKGDVVQSNRTKVVMQTDGDLVIVDEFGGIRWRSGTAGHGERAVFQADGNFVVYDGSWSAWWASNTAGLTGAHLALAPDGNVDIVYQGVVVWSSNTAH